jgi:hypothetical protein
MRAQAPEGKPASRHPERLKNAPGCPCLCEHWEQPFVGAGTGTMVGAKLVVGATVVGRALGA